METRKGSIHFIVVNFQIKLITLNMTNFKLIVQLISYAFKNLYCSHIQQALTLSNAMFLVHQ